MIDPLAGVIAFIGSVINEISKKSEASSSPSSPSPLQPKPEPKPDWYQEPHRDPVSGKIVIENCKLYYADINKHGPLQTQRWMKQGKYNLTPEELEKENERIKANYENL